MKIWCILQDIVKDKNIILPPPTPPPSESKVTIIDPKDVSDAESAEKVDSEKGEKRDLEGKY